MPIEIKVAPPSIIISQGRTFMVTNQRSIFQMLQTILGIRADAPHKRLYVNPTLPEWLPELQIRRLGVGNCAIDLRFWRERDRSRWEVNKLTAVEGTAQGDMIQVVGEVGCNDRVP